MAREKFRLKRAITRRRGRLLSRKEEEGFLRRLRSSPSFAMPRSLSSFSPQLESSSSMVALEHIHMWSNNFNLLNSRGHTILTLRLKRRCSQDYCYLSPPKS